VTRGIFIAGNDSSLLSALGTEAGRRVKKYVSACIPGETPARFHEGLPEWNPASPVSARTLVLAARNQLEHIDEAVLVCVPPAYRRPPADIVPSEIDRFIDYNTKGWFFLVRELAALFRRLGAGTLVLALQEINTETREGPDLAGSSAAASFRAFAQNVVFASAHAPYLAMGFSSAESGTESAFAAYIFKTMEDGRRNSGKWHKFGRFSLFGR
jgi:NAD(P)-dependent dehydrogenase (short-subunit alcohol dehydrogenase family)